MDGASWRTLVANRDAIISVLRRYGGAVPEATVLFHRLKQIDEAVHMSRADLTRAVCLRTKLACFEYARLVEHLVDVDFFESRPIGLYHTYISVFLPYTVGTDRSKGQVVPSEGSTQATEAKWAHLRAFFTVARGGLAAMAAHGLH